MKRILPYLMIPLMLSLIIVNADPNVKLQINQSTLSFKTQPVLVKGELMVPMREFFEALGTQVTWYPDGKVIAAYKNNMYIKLSVDSKVAYRNGKKVGLPIAPYVENGRTLVPARFIAETFDLTLKKISSSSYQFITNSSTPEYYLYSGNFYKKIESPLYGISYHIPSYWQVLNSKSEVYGVNDPYEHNEIRSYYADKSYPSADAYIVALKADLKKKYGSYSILEEKSYPTKNFSFKWIRSTVGRGSSQKNFIHYVTVYNDKAYVLEGQYFDRKYVDDFKEVMKNAATSFSISNVSVQTKDEHYIEYTSAYDHDLRILEEVYSNMEVFGRSTLSGSIQTSISNVIVSVSKDNAQAEFFLPVKKSDSSFSGYYYMPFGLGKHDVTVYLQQASDSKRLKAIQFSVINTSSKQMRYLIPTKYVEKDNSELNGLSNIRTYRISGDYQKAKALLSWMGDTIVLEDKSTKSTIRTAYEVYTENKGTAREAGFLYAALLRTIDIPTRLFMGITNDNAIEYWIEAEINGKWIIIDLTASMINRAAFNAGSSNSYTELYDVSRTDFYKNFKTTAPLND